MTLATIDDLHAKLEQAGCGHGQELRRHGKTDHGHQGDVYLHPIKKRPECWDVETTDQTRQVAVGQGEGSHHCVMGKVRVFWPRNADEAAQECPFKGFFANEIEARKVCLGPVIVAEQAFTMTHPSHAHHEFPAGIYLVTFQLDRRTMRQVRD